MVVSLITFKGENRFYATKSKTHRWRTGAPIIALSSASPSSSSASVGSHVAVKLLLLWLLEHVASSVFCTFFRRRKESVKEILDSLAKFCFKNRESKRNETKIFLKDFGSFLRFAYFSDEETQEIEVKIRISFFPFKNLLYKSDREKTSFYRVARSAAFPVQRQFAFWAQPKTQPQFPSQVEKDGGKR